MKLAITMLLTLAVVFAVDMEDSVKEDEENFQGAVLKPQESVDCGDDG